MHKFDMLSAEVGSTTLGNLIRFFWVLVRINAFSKQKCAMRRRMKKPRGLKVRRYADHIIDLNKYLSVLPGAKEGDTFCETEINENLLNIMTNSWISQAYVQEFDCETISFK